MTTLPTKQNKKLGLVIDLDICVGCHACAVNCKEWNTSGHSSPLHDIDPYGDDPTGVWFNRIHTFEVESEINGSKTCLLYTSPSPRDATLSRMPSSA